MNDTDHDLELRRRQRERWNRAMVISIFAIIGSGILGMVAQDAFFLQPGRQIAPALACRMNLRAIDGAKATWALEFGQSSNSVPADTNLFGEQNYIREKPICPKGGFYILGRVDQKPRCSIPGHTI